MFQPKQTCQSWKQEELNKGFTLLELLVVIAIIGLLSMMLVVAFYNATGGGKKVRICADKCYITDNYLKSDNCISFDNMEICGNYTIEKLEK